MNSLVWTDKPACEWKEGLSIGNGVLAGMVLGGTERERVALNHEWLWRGKHRNKDIEIKDRHLGEIRKLFFEGKVFEAGTLANEVLGGMGGVTGIKNRVDPYQPLGDLYIDFNHKEVTGYRRQLDLETAVVTVSYSVNNIQYIREYFAHAKYKIIVIRLSSAGNSIKAKVSLARIEDSECVLKKWSEKSSFGFQGEFVEGTKFAAQVKVLNGKNIITQFPDNDGSILIESPDEAVLIFTAAVSHNGEDVEARCKKQMDSVPESFKVLRQTHVEEYRRRYNRVSLSIGKPNDIVATDKRLSDIRSGKQDNSLYALYFNFGRYLLISTSWGADLPASLQGKWNEELLPPWDSDYHQDINLQMNYWPAEVCNLSECMNPFFKHVERFIPHAKRAAKQLYGCEGIWLPIQIDPWGRSTPESRGWDVWTGAAAWLVRHFWEHYEYTLDKEFLNEKCYPLLKETAAFYESYLVPDNHGYLVPVPSQSPENFFVGGTKPVSLCIGATMELELIDDVLRHAVTASEILDIDKGKRKEWIFILEKLPPLQIGKYGQLQEWLEDYEEAEPGHRHISHLFALFPGDGITVEETPELAHAAHVSLNRRIAHGGGQSGWSSAWISCCFARLGFGDKSLKQMYKLLTESTAGTLFDLHPPNIFQIDGNFGGAAAIAEMLIQSHKGIIRILPALPSSWVEGKITGLCAQGGFVVDVTWKKGKPVTISVLSGLGQPCFLKLPVPMKARLSSDNVLLKEYSKETDIIEWKAESGKR